MIDYCNRYLFMYLVVMQSTTAEIHKLINDVLDPKILSNVMEVLILSNQQSTD